MKNHLSIINYILSVFILVSLFGCSSNKLSKEIKIAEDLASSAELAKESSRQSKLNALELKNSKSKTPSTDEISQNLSQGSENMSKASYYLIETLKIALDTLESKDKKDLTTSQEKRIQLLRKRLDNLVKK